jgi:hypothetical protein
MVYGLWFPVYLPKLLRRWVPIVGLQTNNSFGYLFTCRSFREVGTRCWSSDQQQLRFPVYLPKLLRRWVPVVSLQTNNSFGYLFTCRSFREGGYPLFVFRRTTASVSCLPAGAFAKTGFLFPVSCPDATKWVGMPTCRRRHFRIIGNGAGRQTGMFR